MMRLRGDWAAFNKNFNEQNFNFFLRNFNYKERKASYFELTFHEKQLI